MSIFQAEKKFGTFEKNGNILEKNCTKPAKKELNQIIQTSSSYMRAIHFSYATITTLEYTHKIPNLGYNLNNVTAQCRRL